MDQEYKFKVGNLRKLFTKYNELKGKEKSRYEYVLNQSIRLKIDDISGNYNAHILSFINSKIDGIEAYWNKYQADLKKQREKRDKYYENIKEITEELKVGDIIIDSDETEWKVLEVLHNGNCMIQKRKGKMSCEIKFEDDHWEEELDEEDQEKDKEPNVFELMFIEV
jgi:hypothetical protein